MSISNLLNQNSVYDLYANSLNGQVSSVLTGTSGNSYSYPFSATGNLTAASLLGQIIQVTGAGGYTATLPTAASVLALISGPQNGMYFQFIVANNSSGTFQVLNNAGGTFITTPNTNTAMDADTNKTFTCVIIDSTGVATPSIIIY